MKNIRKLLPIFLLSGAFVLSCGGGGGGDTPTSKKIIGISISCSEESKKFYFGDAINKSDFTVKTIYNDQTTVTLKDDEYKVLEMKGMGELIEVSFPYTLTYGGGLDSSRNFTFFTNDGEHGASFNVSISKKYTFEYGDGDMNYFSIYFDTEHETSGIKVENRLYYNGKPFTTNVTYESSTSEKGVTVDENGVMSYKGALTNFPNTIISAKVNGICVDKYYLKDFTETVTGMGVDNTTGSMIFCNIGHQTFDPNDDSHLYIPSIWNDDYITGISYELGGSSCNFKNCEKLKRIEIPDSINYIYKDSFNSCTGLEANKIYIPGGVKYIGVDAFTNCGDATFAFENTEGWNWVNPVSGGSGTLSSEWLDNDDNATWLLQQQNIYLYK